MTKEQVIALMASSKSSKEWDENCDKIKRYTRSVEPNKEYPDYWYDEIILSGLFNRTKRLWI